MRKLLSLPALEQFVAATSGRNMTRAAYVAVTSGVALMILLTAGYVAWRSLTAG